MRAGIATDHGGFVLKEEFGCSSPEAGHEVIGFGARGLNHRATIIPTSASRSPVLWRSVRWSVG